eukprot:7270651-Pyramimonas_sp.AAC.1
MRSVRVFVEQPLNSTIYRTAEIMQAFCLVNARRFVTNLGAFGAATVKPIEVWCTFSPSQFGPLVRARPLAFQRLGPGYKELCVPIPRKKPSGKRVSVVRKKPCGSLSKKPSGPLSKKATGHNSYGWSKTGWVSGTVQNGTRQKASSAYPVEFAEAVASVVMKALPRDEVEATRL